MIEKVKGAITAIVDILRHSSTKDNDSKNTFSISPIILVLLLVLGIIIVLAIFGITFEPYLPYF